MGSRKQKHSFFALQKFNSAAIKKEIAEVNKFLDSFPKVKKVTVLQGNHDEWLDRFVEEQGCDEFNGYKFENAIRIKERGWNYLEYGELYQMGKLYAYHGGHYTTKHHCKAHLQALGVNLIYAHMHDCQMHSISQADGTKAAWCLGCLKKLDGKSNKFLKNRKVNWVHSVGIIDFWNNGEFNLHQVNVVNGKAWVWGKEIKGS